MIEVRALGRRYGARTVLENVSFDVGAGQVFGVVGPDGAGKTTLLQMLAAILRPTTGECRVLGHDVRREADRIQARIGYMSQGFSLYDRLTVAENLAFAADIRDVTGSAFADRRLRLLAMAGLERFQDRREGQLSGGCCQSNDNLSPPDAGRAGGTEPIRRASSTQPGRLSVGPCMSLC